MPGTPIGGEPHGLVLWRMSWFVTLDHSEMQVEVTLSADPEHVRPFLCASLSSNGERSHSLFQMLTNPESGHQDVS